MAQAANLAELLEALNQRQPLIEITADIEVTTQLLISYTVELRSLPTEHSILSKTAGFRWSLFRVQNGGRLKLRNITLDGRMAGRYDVNGDNRSLVIVAGGTLDAGDDVTLQNNSSYQEGGGIYVSGSESYSNELVMSGNVRIVGCESRTSGGGLMVALRSNDDRITLSGEPAFQSNHAANGGGIYFRSYLRGVAGVRRWPGAPRISGNTADGAGGGINFSGFRDGGSPGSALIIGPGVRVEHNQATHGGGVYFYGANEGEVFETAGLVENNTASGNGGGLYVRGISTGDSDSPGIRFEMNGGSLADNVGGTGGGVYLLTAVGGSALFSGASVLRNRAVNGSAGSGGGIWLQNTFGERSVSLTMEDTSVRENQASAEGGGLAFHAGPGKFSFDGRNSSLSENRADGNGGGILMGTAGGGLLRFFAVDLSDNLSRGNGGGLYFANTSAAADSVLELSGVEVRGNYASAEGGGLRFTSRTGRLETALTDYLITGNTARAGGGIFNDFQSRTFLFGPGQLSGNQASAYAPGIYNSGLLYMEGLRELSNGVYLSDRNSVVFLRGPLTEGSVIQLDHSDYVKPNEEGIPIVVGEGTEFDPLLTQTDADGFRKPPNDFIGWEIRLSEDHTQVLLAPEVYSIRYENLMGAGHSNPTSYTVLTPEIRLTDPQPLAGERFIGWFDAPAGGNQVTSIPRGSTGNRVLYARWERIVFRIIYYGNDEGGPEAHWVPFPQEAEAGTLAVLSQSVPTRTGDRFIGWNTERDGTGETYQPGAVIGPVTEEIRLYAQWKRAKPVPPDVLPASGSFCRCVPCVPCEPCEP